MLSQLSTIKEWTFRPSEFGICAPERDLSYMMAADIALSKMTAYEMEQRETQMNRELNRSKRHRFE